MLKGGGGGIGADDSLQSQYGWHENCVAKKINMKKSIG